MYPCNIVVVLESDSLMRIIPYDFWDSALSAVKAFNAIPGVKFAFATPVIKRKS
jgi:hypothetical protein